MTVMYKKMHTFRAVFVALVYYFKKIWIFKITDCVSAEFHVKDPEFEDINRVLASSLVLQIKPTGFNPRLSSSEGIEGLALLSLTVCHWNKSLRWGADTWWQ